MQRCYQHNTLYIQPRLVSLLIALSVRLLHGAGRHHSRSAAVPAMTLHHALVSHPFRHHCAQVADCLAKVARQVTAAAADAVKREGLLAGVAELGAAHDEAAWLTSYEQDDDRYKASPQGSSPTNI